MNHQQIIEVRIDGKFYSWYGFRIPKTSKEILDSIKSKQEVKQNDTNRTQ